jgi:hypothetical protein
MALSPVEVHEAAVHRRRLGVVKRRAKKPTLFRSAPEPGTDGGSVA